ncbi:MAG: hypothetical protein ACRDXD_04880 [Acidimicrobiia bacterium]
MLHVVDLLAWETQTFELDFGGAGINAPVFGDGGRRLVWEQRFGELLAYAREAPVAVRPSTDPAR